jgi:Transposase DDE domain group 1
MPTECSAELFEFARVEGRIVVAGFDGGAITSDAGALLLGATDRAIQLVDRFAECFIDRRNPKYIEHQVATLIGQRVHGIALGYEDLNPSSGPPTSTERPVRSRRLPASLRRSARRGRRCPSFCAPTAALRATC